jgi:hypothetical protein
VVVFAVACLAGGLTADLHHPLLLGLQQQLTQWPVGEPARWGPALAGLDARVIAAAHGYLALAFALMTPVLLSVAVVDLTLRLTVRGVATAPGDVLRPWLATGGGAGGSGRGLGGVSGGVAAGLGRGVGLSAAGAVR